MGRVTDHVIAVTVGGLVTHVHLAEAVVADLPGVTVRVHQALAGVVTQVTDGGGVLAIVIRRASWFALVPSAVLAGVLRVGGREVAQAVVVLAVAVHAAAIAVSLVDALEVGGAVGPGALVETLVIGAALRPRHHVVTNLGAVDVAGPAAHRAHGILERDIE